MSLVNGVWHDARIDPPENGKQVLCVKQTKNGTRSLCFGSYWRERQHNELFDDRWVTTGSCNNVLYWMPLPKIPEEV